MWPTRADGISCEIPSTMPSPARRIGTSVSFLPATWTPRIGSSAGFTRALIWSPRSVGAAFVTRLEALPPRYTSVVAALSEDASDRWLRPRLEADFGQVLLNQHVASLPVSGRTALALPRGTHDSAAGRCHAGQ